MGAVCDALVRVLDERTATGRRVLGWSGDGFGDALPLRLAGGLHALVRAGLAPELASAYRPNTTGTSDAANTPDRPDEPEPGRLVDLLADALAQALVEHDERLLPWLEAPPQTNEVGRSAVLAAGLLFLTRKTGPLPLRLFELGASAGLNLRLDAYHIDLGSQSIGRLDAPVGLRPAWQGPSRLTAENPAELVVASRRGVDLAPVDVTDPAARERLLAYVWPDQTERLRRLEAALAAAALDPPTIDRADAADWTESYVDLATGTTTVLFHSIAHQYFPHASRARIERHMAQLGTRATSKAPLAWLRFEMEDASTSEALPTLRLVRWPSGEERLLARAHPHGESIEWLEEAEGGASTQIFESAPSRSARRVKASK